MTASKQSSQGSAGLRFEDLPLNGFCTLRPDQKSALKQLGLVTIRDFLYYFPKKYAESSEAVQIQTILNSDKEIGDDMDGKTSSGGKTDAAAVTATESIIFGQISNLKTGRTFKGKLPMATATLTDDTGSVKLMWIRQPYIAKMIQEGSLVKISGKVTKKDSDKGGQPIFINPRIESVGAIPSHIGQPLFASNPESENAPELRESISCTPTYAETKGITSLWFFHAFKKISADPRFSDPSHLPDPIPEDIRKKYSLPGLQTALIWIHAPQKESDAMVARKRFAFEEIFFIQLRAQIERAKSEREKSFVISDQKNVEAFIDRLGFSMTEGQRSSVEDILGDMKRGYPMSRLLEGDVGSGKTAVAATASYAVVTERPKNQKFGTLQVAYMAPTEILAKQHFESFIQLFKHMPISIGLITGKECRKFPSKLAGTKLAPNGWTHISRSQLTKWVKNGEIAIVIGTHALIQKNVAFKHLALVIIDEQHRFGTNQRQKLARKHDITPHLLSMTATPIPRTLALTLYGDLDLSVIEQMPSGRKPIITKIIKPEEQAAAYEHIRELVNEGRQAYVICPRIDEPDEEPVIPLYMNNDKRNSATMTNPAGKSSSGDMAGTDSARETKQMKSVIGEAKRLNKEVFPEFKFGILHSRMKPALKEEVMNKFLNKEIDILVATSVVEVGVNVPNATVILIEHADRYGLSQLHQLRGRVIRGNHQAFCYLATSTSSDKSIERLKAIESAKNGFELAELDLKLRGIGELYSGKQWGVTDIAMDAIQNLKMVEAARSEAKGIVAEDITLSGYPLLQKMLVEQEEIHFE
jgi:ATP-dependent DNA helicase RecG